jgi:hypothetical protein
LDIIFHKNFNIIFIFYFGVCLNKYLKEEHNDEEREKGKKGGDGMGWGPGAQKKEALRLGGP